MKVKVKDIVKMAQALIDITYNEGYEYGEEDAVDIANQIVDATANEYERGWHDALEMALKETFTSRSEDGTFRYVQEETLIGLGMSHQESRINLEREIEI